ncbi:MAG: histidine phosphatase family protein [Ardenticatenales bacterium]|nr:histidine phosphatase family protein [Ardenticatenales bacterium]
MSQRRLHIVRHGQYISTVEPLTEPDGPLTPLGRQQAAATGQRLAQLPIGVIHHSTLQRATEMAQIIAAHFAGVELRPSALLRECIPCVPAGFEPHFAHIPVPAITQGPLQAAQVYEHYFTSPGEEDQQEIIVSSGNLIGYFVGRMLDAPVTAWLHMDLQHGALTEVLLGPPRGRLLVRYNDVGHLPASWQTFQ